VHSLAYLSAGLRSKHTKHQWLAVKGIGSRIWTGTVTGAHMLLALSN